MVASPITPRITPLAPGDTANTVVLDCSGALNGTGDTVTSILHTAVVSGTGLNILSSAINTVPVTPQGMTTAVPTGRAILLALSVDLTAPSTQGTISAQFSRASDGSIQNRRLIVPILAF